MKKAHVCFLSLLILLCTPGLAKTKIEKVFVQIAKKKEISDIFTYPGRVIPKVSAVILAENQGIVGEISSQLGDKVKRNQVVAKVKHLDPSYQYQAMRLRSPVSGIVSKVFTNPGGQVAKGDKIIQIIDPAKTKILIEVVSRDLPSIKKGMPGIFYAGAEKRPYKIKITGLSPIVDPATGTATAELSLEDNRNTTTPITPGILGKVEFKTNVRQGFMFPQNVLSYKGNESQVKIVSKDGSKVSRVPVKIGLKSRGEIEILSGVKEGDYLIERTSGFIKEGAKVAIQNLPKSDVKTIDKGGQKPGEQGKEEENKKIKKLKNKTSKKRTQVKTQQKSEGQS